MLPLAIIYKKNAKVTEMVKFTEGSIVADIFNY